MIHNAPTRRRIVFLAVLVAVVALGCQNASSPTAPGTVEPSALGQESANYIVDSHNTFWAKLMADPIVSMSHNRDRVILDVECRHTQYGASSDAYFMCRGEMAARCAQLRSGERIYVSRAEPMEARGGRATWLVLEFTRID